MATALALAAVTHVIRELLERAAPPEPQELLGNGAVWTVSTIAPDLIERGPQKPPLLNLYLYHVAPNRALRNQDARTHDAAGNRVAAPPLALDLRYLITAYGSTDYQAELLLGHAMLALHDHPVLSRDLIADAFAGDNALQVLLAGAGLDAQPESIGVKMEALEPDALERIWAGLQLGMRPSLSCLVTVVLITSRARAQAAAPVRTRAIAAVPMDPPFIAGVEVADDPAAPVESGAKLRITGRRLFGPGTMLSLGGADMSALVDPNAPGFPATLTLALPDPLPSGLRAGVQGMRVEIAQELVEGGGTRSFLRSNMVAVALRPRVTGATLAASGEGPGLLVTFAHEVGDRQNVEILLDPIVAGEIAGPGRILPVPAGNFDVPPPHPPARGDLTRLWLPLAAPAGTYAVRARIDRVEGVRMPVASAVQVTVA